MSIAVLDDLASALDELPVPARVRGKITAAHTDLLNGDPDSSIERLSTLVNDGPTVPYLRGIAYYLRGDIRQATLSLKAAVAADPEAARPRLFLAHVLMLSGQPAEAVTTLEPALLHRPNEPRTVAALAEALSALDRSKTSETIVRAALKEHPESVPLRKALSKSLRRQDRHHEAVQWLRRAIADAPNDDEIRVGLGRSLLALGDPASAEPLFAAVLRCDTESTGALAGMAEALARQGRRNEANGYVLRAMAAAPDQAWLHLLYGRLALEDGRPEEAQRAAMIAATLAPGDPKILRLAMQAAWHRRLYAEAAEQALRLLERVPGDPEATAIVAVETVLEDQPNEARAALAPLLVGSDIHPMVNFAAGCAALSDGDATTATAIFLNVIRQWPSDPVTQRLLRLSYARQVQPRLDAERAMRRILRTGEDVDFSEFEDEQDEDPTAQIELDAEPEPKKSFTVRRPTGPIAPLVEAAVSRVLGSQPAAITPTPDPGPRSVFPALAEPFDSLPPMPSGVTARPTAPIERVYQLQCLLEGADHLAPLLAQSTRLIDRYDGPLQLALAGPIGAGRTVFLNGLIGRSVIPLGASWPCTLRYGRALKARVVQTDGRVDSIPIEALSELENDPQTIRRIDILAPIRELLGVQIIDAPEPPPEVDGVLWLAGVHQAMTVWDKANLWLKQYPLPAMAIATQIDRIPPSRVIDRHHEIEARLGERVSAVVTVSAQVGLKGLAKRDVTLLKASGFGRLHRTLTETFFDQAGVIRDAATHTTLNRLIQNTQEQLKQRIQHIAIALSTLQTLAEQVIQDQVVFQVEVRAEGGRLPDAFDKAIKAALVGWMPNHRIDGLRSRLRSEILATIAGLNSGIDARLSTLLHGYSDILGSALPTKTTLESLQTALDGLRLLALEQVFGRHYAYLEAWVEQAPLDTLVAPNPVNIRTDGLRLDRVRPPQLRGFASLVFATLLDFIADRCAELQATHVDLAGRLDALKTL